MKIKLGAMVGQASGSVGSTTASHNRYGTYMRRRAIPVISTTTAAMNAKARFGQMSSAWGDLTDAQRLAWKTWAQSNPIIDRLGDAQILDGHAAYVQINTRLNQAGTAALTVPPLGSAPTALTTYAATYDIGAGTSTLVYTPSPIGAANRLWLQAAVLDNPARNYVRNLLRVVHISAVNAASPYDYQSAVEAVFGPLQVGQKLVLQAYVFDNSTGMLSAPIQLSGIITST